MKKLQSFLTSKYILWLMLAIPAILTTKNGIIGQTEYPMLMHITGEFAGRFLAIALLITPLCMLLPAGGFSKWLLRNRRFFGVAAFAYTLLHTLFYVFEYPMDQLLNEFTDWGIITGWIAFIIFIPLAMTSTNVALKILGSAWKKLQRWVYLAGLMAFIHWCLLGLQGEHASMGGALFHFVPVMLLQIYRVWKVWVKKSPKIIN